jgi:hypothetical protein
MIRSGLLALSTVLALGAASAPARAAVGPKALVGMVYAKMAVSMDGSDMGRYLTGDLLAAMRRATPPGEAGPVDFDYRYGSQDPRISGLNILEVIDNDDAKVVAVFKNHGRPFSVNWKLCRAASGDWRIYDAWSNTGSEWDLRQLLALPARPGRC